MGTTISTNFSVDLNFCNQCEENNEVQPTFNILFIQLASRPTLKTFWIILTDFIFSVFCKAEIYPVKKIIYEILSYKLYGKSLQKYVSVILIKFKVYFCIHDIKGFK